MRDQNLVNALREHAEWAEGNQLRLRTDRERVSPVHLELLPYMRGQDGRR